MLTPQFDPLKFSRPPGASQLDRRQLIAQAAFRRAQQRGFGTGKELEDWLAAEVEVDYELSLRYLRTVD